MVEKYLVSAFAAVVTAVVMAAVSSWGLKREKISADKKHVCWWVAGAVIYLAAAFLFEYYGYSLWKKVRYDALLCALPVLSLTDRKDRRIPNHFLVILAILRLLILAGEIISYPLLWTDFMAHACGGAAGSFLLMMAAWFLSRKKIGLGDVKLLTVMGFYLGFSLNYIILFLSLIFAALWGVWNVWRKKMDVKDTVAFAPFITAGLFTALILSL